MSMDYLGIIGSSSSGWKGSIKEGLGGWKWVVYPQEYARIFTWRVGGEWGFISILVTARSHKPYNNPKPTY